MLSEKAKGKQRAVEVSGSGNAAGSSTSNENLSTLAPEPQETQRDLVIRFTEGLPDLTVQVGPHDAVRDIKKRIRDARPQLLDRRLRLIHAGRILTEETLFSSWVSSIEERQKRVPTSPAEGDEAAQTSAPLGGIVTWMHCSVGPKLEPGEEAEEERPQLAQLQPARGFDRLAAVGFSEEDIANFRRQFHSQSASNYLDADFETEEEYDEYARALEEQWIDSLDNAGTASLSQAGDAGNSNMLHGILIGFFFPLIPFFFMRSSKPAIFWEDGSEPDPAANVIFPRRTQMGLVIGFLANIMFGMWRYFLDST
ncbi:hypothetical protein BDN72DRAFT_396135 [Pluteus cervinus]|uniref:Uncharacterized protein n=2 Tax=Pluteus cervinus TaxID=181527 RepID=A0ACD3A8R9_9AGAR|nr:hypothetical protein BDN72DRAFT_398438 [Pluteus cervinus]TFK62314.1 hypothetical protein BDN72DRAFT_396135 [Pluteus cervinus]